MPNKSATHASEKDRARKPHHRGRASSHQAEQVNAADALARTLNAPANAIAPADILALQRTAGNRAVEQLLTQRVQPQGSRRLTIQTKLTLGAADDPYEREADRIAATVVQASESSAAHVQRQTSEEVDQELLQAKPLASFITPLVQRQQMPHEDEDLHVQRRATGDMTSVEPAVDRAIEGSRGAGQPLPEDLRARMEQAFGTDFSAVRVHTGAEADGLARSLKSRAFTTGHDLFFKSGEYNSASSEGQHLLAHELTHVMQQQGSPGRIKTARRERVFKSPLVDSTTAHGLIQKKIDPLPTETDQLNGVGVLIPPIKEEDQKKDPQAYAAKRAEKGKADHVKLIEYLKKKHKVLDEETTLRGHINLLQKNERTLPAEKRELKAYLKALDDNKQEADELNQAATAKNYLLYIGQLINKWEDRILKSQEKKEEKSKGETAVEKEGQQGKLTKDMVQKAIDEKIKLDTIQKALDRMAKERGQDGVKKLEKNKYLAELKLLGMPGGKRFYATSTTKNGKYLFNVIGKHQ